MYLYHNLNTKKCIGHYLTYRSNAGKSEVLRIVFLVSFYAAYSMNEDSAGGGANEI